MATSPTAILMPLLLAGAATAAEWSRDTTSARRRHCKRIPARTANDYLFEENDDE